MEVYGIIVVVFAVILLLSLASFDATDLDPERRGSLSNWIGPVGAHLASLFLKVFGVGAFAVSGAFMAVGGCVLVGWRPTLTLRQTGLWLMLLTSAAVLLHMATDGHRVLDHRAGGLVGMLLGEGLRALVSDVGSVIVASTSAAIAIMLLTGRSLLSPFRFVARKGAAAGTWLYGRARAGAVEWWEEVREALDERRQRREARKEAVRLQREAERTDREAAWAESAAAKTEVSAPPSEAKEAKARRKPAQEAEPVVKEVAPEPVPETREAAETPVARPAPRPAEPAGPQTAVAKGKPSAEPKIVESGAMKKARVDLVRAEQEVFDFASSKDYQLPPLSFLDYEPPKGEGISREVLKDNARILEQKLLDFGVTGKVVEIHPGPVITMYEFKPAAGVKISKIANLSDDLTMALAAMRIRIVAPIPGKDVVGIEVPNKAREIVYLKEIFSDDAFQRAKSKLMLALGKDIVGYPTTFDLAKAPHLLVAGSTGSGKSVAINSFICSLLYKATPADVRLIMVDPKMLELSVYEGIPHLLLPVVTDPKKAAVALKWAVGEMERRYKLMASLGVRNVAGFNLKIEKLLEIKAHEEAALAMRAHESIRLDEEGEEDEDDLHFGPPEPLDDDEPLEKLPYIVIIIDELADLMMVASKDVETSIARLAQMARAAGIHMVLATQRPSVDVITGLIKANFPTRISFQVASKIDSRTILDRQGAENLLGQGDMLLLPPGSSKLIRCHGAYVGEEEIARITSHIKAQAKPQYCMDILKDEGGESLPEEDKEYDEFYDQAVAIVAETRQASISYLQRRLKIGYNRAARIVEVMEREGIVAAATGPGPREVLIDPI
ncbi:MAG: DNA translocase FtsK [Myxococcales bacterium]